MIRILRKLSEKYGITIIYEKFTQGERYVVDYGGENPRDFWIAGNIKQAKMEMIKYLEEIKRR